jgi:hypothetical protein
MEGRCRVCSCSRLEEECEDVESLHALQIKWVLVHVCLALVPSPYISTTNSEMREMERMLEAENGELRTKGTKSMLWKARGNMQERIVVTSRIFVMYAPNQY